MSKHTINKLLLIIGVLLIYVICELAFPMGYLFGIVCVFIIWHIPDWYNARRFTKEASQKNLSLHEYACLNVSEDIKEKMDTIYNSDDENAMITYKKAAKDLIYKNQITTEQYRIFIFCAETEEKRR